MVAVNIGHSPETFNSTNGMFNPNAQLTNDGVLLTLLKAQRTVLRLLVGNNDIKVWVILLNANKAQINPGGHIRRKDITNA
jgi:hypothetical protein